MSIFLRPQCLIETGHDGRLRIVVETMQQVEKLDKPFTVVTIAGPYRTGKSYLLNRLTGKNVGFALGSTIQSKTKGIWIWTVCHPRQKDKYLILLDTEGLGDAEKGDAKHDLWILCLGCLYSSVLVYNVLGIIIDEDLKKLGSATDMCRQIKSRDQKTDQSFPVLAYALRDFFDDLDNYGNTSPEKEYLEKILISRSGKSDSQVNKAKEYLIKSFKHRECFTFDRPAKRNVLKNLENVADSEISSDFLKDSDKFCSFIFDNSPIKKNKGVIMHGREWAVQIRAYLKEISCEWNKENENLLETCLEFYRVTFSEKANCQEKDESDLTGWHDIAVAQALNLFSELTPGDPQGTFYFKLQSQLSHVYEDVLHKRRETSKTICMEILYGSQLKSRLLASYYYHKGGLNQYTADVETIKKTFLENSGLGCEFKEVLLNFIDYTSKIREVIKHIEHLIIRGEPHHADIDKLDIACDEKRRIENNDEKTALMEQVKEIGMGYQMLNETYCGEEHKYNLKKFESRVFSLRIKTDRYDEKVIPSVKVESIDSEIERLKQEIRKLCEEQEEKVKGDLIRIAA